MFMPEPLVFPDLDAARDQWPLVVGLLDEETLRAERWFQARTAGPFSREVTDYAFLPWPYQDELVCLTVLRVRIDAEVQDYFLPMILLEERPGLPVLARLTVGGKPYVLAEASLSRRVDTSLLAELAAGHIHEGQRGRFVFHPAAPGMVRAVEPLAGDSSNTVLRLHRDEVQKIIRRLRPGLSREVRIGLALRDHPFLPGIHGHLTYEVADGTIYTLCIWQEFLPNRGSLWDELVASLTALLRTAVAPGCPMDPGTLLTQWLHQAAPDLERLTATIANFHAALARMEEPSAFAPADIKPIAARIQSHLARVSATIAPEPPDLWTRTANLAEHLAGKLSAVGEMGQKLQTHGDLHLGQILLTAEGYAILDLEGEPLLDPEERASHLTPLRDLAGLVRSFSYTGQAARLALRMAQPVLSEQDDMARFLTERFAERTSQTVIQHYGAAIARLAPGLVPGDPVTFMNLLDLCRLEKVLYEIAYELAHRPDWVAIPLAGLRGLLAERMGSGVPG